MMLFFRPMYLSVMQMNILIIIFIFLFFGYQYKKDPPQGAYLDKIMFLFLLITSMDVLHNWGYVKSVETVSYLEVFNLGQFVIVPAELGLVLFFILRLRFISSVQGEFYEKELAANPRQISRWRDWIDNMVLSHFFNNRFFQGRLFEAHRRNNQ